jgi:predicted transcriptional regulator
MSHTTSKSEKARQMHMQFPELPLSEIAKRVGVTRSTVAQALEHAPKAAPEEAEADPKKLSAVAAKLLKDHALSPKTLANSLGISVDGLDDVLEELGKTHTVTTRGGLLALTTPAFGHIPVEVTNAGAWTRIGLVADTHLACKEERLDALHNFYDVLAAEGISDVYHAGNPVDGYIERINGASVICATADDQAQYMVDNYPARKGIITHFITGDDHEGWWIKEGFNWGWYLQQLAQEQGRKDLHYIGHVEADVEFKLANGNGSAIMKIQHPGGGSAYARSYTGQKQVEAFQGGEKPAILVQGHYHVSNHMIERNVHVISMPGFQDQTVFARKKRLRMEIGGAILEFKQNPADGSLTRVRVEFKPYFDRGYYKRFLRSDSKLVKGHVVNLVP